VAYFLSINWASKTHQLPLKNRYKLAIQLITMGGVSMGMRLQNVTLQLPGHPATSILGKNSRHYAKIFANSL